MEFELMPRWMFQEIPDLRAEEWYPLGVPGFKNRGWAHKTAVISEDAAPHEGVVIREGARVDDGVELHRWVVVGARACLEKHVVVEEFTRIGEDARVAEGVRLPDRIHVPANVVVTADPFVLEQRSGAGTSPIDNRYPVYHLGKRLIGACCEVNNATWWASNLERVCKAEKYTADDLERCRQAVAFIARRDLEMFPE